MDKRDFCKQALAQKLTKELRPVFAISDETLHDHIECMVQQMLWSLEYEQYLEITGVMGQTMLYRPGQMV